ncbi:FMN-dependent dehydrogenase-domain-containing protein [Amanita rubescens]|nr:FMN-dependent dehydrogenase-domain-containing protein [Amanita rubescens]
MDDHILPIVSPMLSWTLGQKHPGGPQVILQHAGKDATEPFEIFHVPGALKSLPAEKNLGPLTREDAATLTNAQRSKLKTKDQLRVEEAHKQKPPLQRILNLMEMEVVARNVLSHKAWAYYSSASDDEITHAENARAFSRFFFLPRVLRPVGDCDPTTTILGYPSSLPIFRINITIGVYTSPQNHLIQMVSSNASLPFHEIAKATHPGQTLFFQLYKPHDNIQAEQRVRAVEEAGYKAIFLTVDAIVAGRRERDIRSPWVLEDEERGFSPVHSEEREVGSALEAELNSLGTAGALIADNDRNMTWEKTIPWLRGITKLPIVIKGVQCVEDAVLAVEAGVDGILLSNHGGISLPPIEVLYRLRKQRPDVFNKLEGGVYRGTDVLKALCLGARAVGLGRAFLYAQGAYGAAGVSWIIRILEQEIVTGMGQLGVRTIGDLTPEMDWQPLTGKL